MNNYLFTGVCCVLVAISFYLLGVMQGKRYELRRLTLEFHQVLLRLLHFAAQQDYKQLHLMLQDLVAEQATLDELRQQESAPEDLRDALERASQARMQRPSAAPAPSPPEDES